MNFVFRKGECVLIRGNNGCGKSTLTKLILGLYIGDYEGQIFINDVDIKLIDINQFREKHVGIVRQSFEDIDLIFTEKESNLSLGQKQM